MLGILVAGACLTNVSAKGATYSNPVLAGDYPDPSVIRVGEEYWATATTSEWAPLFPILHSRDLVHWQLEGAVFHTRPDWSAGNYWAPEISEYRGRYYVYYVGRKKNGPLSIAVATAASPAGPWTDHGPLIGQEAGSIDPVTAIDEKGERYLIWKEDGNSRQQPTPLWMQKLSEDGAKLVGEMKEILRNDAPWEKNLVEGPFILRHAGWFYLFYSGNGCCGRGCNYALGVARSQSLFGSWEKNPANPILPGNDDWKCPGHGSIVTDPRGRDFLLYHAYQAKNFVYVGRQGLLDEVNWSAGGWPVINSGRGPSSRALAPLAQPPPNGALEFFDDFTSPKLKPDWQWPQSNEPSVRIDNQGELLLSPKRDQAHDLIGAVLGIKTTSGDYIATALLDARGITAGAMAGLSAFGDRENALGVAIRDSKVVVWRRQRNKHETLATSDAPGGPRLFFRIAAKEGHRFQFAISSDGGDWKNVGQDIDVEGNYLPPWDRGVRVALTVGGAENALGKFDWLRIVPQESK
jgi:beta-xylosidase